MKTKFTFLNRIFFLISTFLKTHSLEKAKEIAIKQEFERIKNNNLFPKRIGGYYKKDKNKGNDIDILRSLGVVFKDIGDKDYFQAIVPEDWTLSYSSFKPYVHYGAPEYEEYSVILLNNLDKILVSEDIYISPLKTNYYIRELKYDPPKTRQIFKIMFRTSTIEKEEEIEIKRAIRYSLIPKNMKGCKKRLEDLGVIFSEITDKALTFDGSNKDDILYKATLPSNWYFKYSGDFSYNLMNDKDEIVAYVFYKGIIYDRRGNVTME